ncbi:thioredoxin [Candidatus Woesearchaeota archaeon]|nr:thioredoxin [Candidatus Woesearchaeota archaeon]
MSVKELSKTNFDESVKGDKPVIVDFWASWCGPCKMMGPVFDELSEEYDNLEFAKVSTELEPELAEKNSVRGIPCLIVFKDGKEVDRIVGYTPKDALKEKINAIIN